jgi:hypothetical protein
MGGKVCQRSTAHAELAAKIAAAMELIILRAVFLMMGTFQITVAGTWCHVFDFASYVTKAKAIEVSMSAESLTVIPANAGHPANGLST